MAKSNAAPKHDEVETPPEKGLRVTVFNLKGAPEYKEWLDELSEFSHMPTATLFDVAIAEWAKLHGFPKVPPKRQMR
jgi:hypothetical protein